MTNQEPTQELPTPHPFVRVIEEELGDELKPNNTTRRPWITCHNERDEPGIHASTEPITRCFHANGTMREEPGTPLLHFLTKHGGEEKHRCLC